MGLAKDICSKTEGANHACAGKIASSFSFVVIYPFKDDVVRAF